MRRFAKKGLSLALWGKEKINPPGSVQGPCRQAGQMEKAGEFLLDFFQRIQWALTSVTGLGFVEFSRLWGVAAVQAEPLGSGNPC